MPREHVTAGGINALNQIDTIVVLLMENRSFDHVLGYLSLPPFNRAEVEGLKTPLSQYALHHGGVDYDLYRVTDAYKPVVLKSGRKNDPWHDRAHIATQIASGAMDGFIKSFPEFDVATGGASVMGYFMGSELKTTHFFAEEFAICDRWFSPLPAGTQPNRLMSVSGYSEIADNVDVPVLPNQDTVMDWLDARDVKWRLYHDGLPFLAVMPKYTIPAFNPFGPFRRFGSFASDWRNDDLGGARVIFVDPKFTDDPVSGGENNDDHMPTPPGPGQDFMMRLYRILTSNPAKWNRTMLVVDYDEHGGFFDHFPPPAVRTASRDGSYAPFETLGVRVPGFVVSPFVSKGSVYQGVLDHTSVLKMLGDKYGGGRYSPEVDARAVGSLTAVLDLDVPRAEIPRLEAIPPSVDETAEAFRAAWLRAAATPGSGAQEKYPHVARQELVQPDAPTRKAARMALLATAPPATALRVEKPPAKKVAKKAVKKTAKKPPARVTLARATSKRKK